jgi:hypothetical protein
VIDDVWKGEFFELHLRFSAGTGDAALRSALEALWARVDLAGPFSKSDWNDPDRRASAVADVMHGQAEGQNGWAQAPREAQLPFVLILRHQLWRGTPVLTSEGCGLDDSLPPEPRFEIELDIPFAAIEAEYDIRPYEVRANIDRIQETLRPWLRDLAQTVFEVAPFEVGVAGQELYVADLLERPDRLWWDRVWKLLPDDNRVVSWIAPSVE